MEIVDPSTRVCLVLEPSYMPRQVCTARSAFYHLMKSHGHGLTITGEHMDWNLITTNNLVVSPDQPVMRSAHNVWPIPTIFVANQAFFYKKRKEKKSVSLMDLYKAYKGICQICLQHKQLKEFSRDHIFPQSKGGTDDAENLILACKQCNSHKSDIYPYYNVRGEMLKPKKFFNNGFFMPEVHDIRPEWESFLFLK